MAGDIDAGIEDALVRKQAELPFVPKSCGSYAGSAEPHSVLLVLHQIYARHTRELVMMFGAAAFGARPRGTKNIRGIMVRSPRSASFSRTSTLSIGARHWTAQDDKRLLELKGAGMSNKDIAQLMPGRSKGSINGRWFLCGPRDQHGILHNAQKPWTAEEDRQLQTLVEAGVELRSVGAHMTRSGSGAIARWYSVVRPKVEALSKQPPVQRSSGQVLATQSHTSPSASSGSNSSPKAPRERRGRARTRPWTEDETAQIVHDRHVKHLDFITIAQQLDRSTFAVRQRYASLPREQKSRIRVPYPANYVTSRTSPKAQP